MKARLITLLRLRVEDEITDREDLAILKKYDVEDYINPAIIAIYNLTKNSEEKIHLAPLASAVGRKVMLRLEIKKDSGLSARIGCFILYSFEQMRILQLAYGKSMYKHAAYLVTILDQDLLDHLWQGLASAKNGILPRGSPHPAWTSTERLGGMKLIKTNSKRMLREVTPEKCPMLFEAINKMQLTAYQVNREVLEVATWAFKEKEEAFSDIWEEASKESQVSKLRDTKAIFTIAKKVKYFPWYHMYQVDFRSRCYPTTGYFTSQGTDLSKGLILREESKEVGEAGHVWLLISVANLWGGDSGDSRKTDKLPLTERAQWTVINEDWILECARDPKEHKEWMKADKPWCFLATIFELKNLREHGDLTYKSHLEVWIDGTCSGLQHLSALTRDHETGPFVNLTKREQVGDLYAHMAKGVWKRIEEHYRGLTDLQQRRSEKYIQDTLSINRRIAECEEYSEEYKFLTDGASNLRNSAHTITGIAWVVFWRRITDPKERRKILKRNIMTIAYGSTPYGMSQQQIDDARKHSISVLRYMTRAWPAKLGREIYDAAQDSLKRPMELLRLFSNAGERADKAETYLRWTTPIVNIPIEQHYAEGVVKKVWINWGAPKGVKLSTGYYLNTLQLHICFIEELVQSRRKQKGASAPNITHSLDATHLIMTVCAVPFNMTTVHDSFGCLIGDMPVLYEETRKQFHRLYKNNPLPKILEEIEVNEKAVDYGKLDIDEVLESEFLFS